MSTHFCKLFDDRKVQGKKLKVPKKRAKYFDVLLQISIIKGAFIYFGNCHQAYTNAAIPAYDLRALYDHGSGELSPRFDHRFPSFEVTFAIEPEWLSCCRQTHLAVEA